jgi:abhydrolase domain-containing protein 17
VSRVRLLPFDKFDNESKIRRYRGPLLVIQGTSDEVVPFRQGQRIFALASGPKQSLWVPGAHHNDVLFTATQKYLDALHAFTASLGT